MGPVGICSTIMPQASDPATKMPLAGEAFAPTKVPANTDTGLRHPSASCTPNRGGRAHGARVRVRASRVRRPQDRRAAGPAIVAPRHPVRRHDHRLRISLSRGAGRVAACRGRFRGAADEGPSGVRFPGRDAGLGNDILAAVADVPADIILLPRSLSWLDTRGPNGKPFPPWVFGCSRCQRQRSIRQRSRARWSAGAIGSRAAARVGAWLDGVSLCRAVR
jgi:hypothetical protein